MTIKQNGGIFGRNPSFKSIELDGADLETTLDAKADLAGDTFTGTVNVSTSGNAEINATRASGSSARMQAQSARAVIGTTTNHELRFMANNAQYVNLSTAGDLSVMSGNLVIGTSGKGIDFSATSGTGTSELFDDYEEGGWNPVYIPQTGSFATMTMSVSEAKYTKIGRFVYIQASILTDNVDTTGASGGLRLSGLPFSSSGFGSFIVSYAQNWGGDVPLYGYIENGTTYANLRYRTSVNGADSSMLVGDLTTGAVASQNYMIVSGVYTVA